MNSTRQLRVSGVKNMNKAMMIMELPVGANNDKKSVALSNLTQMMDSAHAVRAPGPAALDIAWVGAGSADCYFHFGKYSIGFLKFKRFFLPQCSKFLKSLRNAKAQKLPVIIFIQCLLYENYLKL